MGSKMVDIWMVLGMGIVFLIAGITAHNVLAEGIAAGCGISAFAIFAAAGFNPGRRA